MDKDEHRPMGGTDGRPLQSCRVTLSLAKRCGQPARSLACQLGNARHSTKDAARPSGTNTSVLGLEVDGITNQSVEQAGRPLPPRPQRPQHPCRPLQQSPHPARFSPPCDAEAVQVTDRACDSQEQLVKTRQPQRAIRRRASPPSLRMSRECNALALKEGSARWGRDTAPGCQCARARFS